MRKTYSTLFALAAAFMVQGFVPATANAMTVGKVQAGTVHTGITPVRHYRNFNSYGGGGPQMHHRFHRRHFFGPSIYFYGGPSYYRYRSYGYGGCYWLKERALETGRRYWWRRYWECRNGY